MDISEVWDKAIRETKIIRAYLATLETFQVTKLPYIFLAKSTVNIGDTVVKKGEVHVNKPSIILPENYPQFEGFEFEKELKLNTDLIRTYLIMRGVSFPSLKYKHMAHNVEVYEGNLDKAIKHYKRELERTEETKCGLVAGPSDIWQFSILIYVAQLMVKSVPKDIEKLLDDFRRKNDKH